MSAMTSGCAMIASPWKPNNSTSVVSSAIDPDDPEREGDDLPPWPSRAARWVYARSLGLALAGLFVLSFVAHWRGSLAAANEEARLHGTEPHAALAYLADAGFWFESFQNWQSEFLSTAVLVVLSIWLRHRGSPESKPVAASDRSCAPSKGRARQPARPRKQHRASTGVLAECP